MSKHSPGTWQRNIPPTTKYVIRADRITPGTILLNGHLSDLHVEDVGDNSMGDVVLRCSYTPGTYPATTLMLRPDEMVPIRP